MSTDLSPPSNARSSAVAAWLAESIGDCASCSGPIRRTDGHRAADGGFVHVDCEQSRARSIEAAEEPTSLAVEARGRRSDWD